MGVTYCCKGVATMTTPTSIVLALPLLLYCVTSKGGRGEGCGGGVVVQAPLHHQRAQHQQRRRIPSPRRSGELLSSAGPGLANLCLATCPVSGRQSRLAGTTGTPATVVEVPV